MAKRKVKDKEFDFENTVKVRGPLTKTQIKTAQGLAKEHKVLKSVRYDASLLNQIQKLAAREGLPYQTLMSMLLKKGLEVLEGRIDERLEKVESQLAEIKKERAG